MSEGPEFSSRVALSERIIEAAKAVVRILSGRAAPDTELALARRMVELRETLVQARNEVGISDGGPRLMLKDVSPGRAYSAFNDGFKTIATSYLAIQDKRCGDLDWTEAAQECANLRDGIVSMIEFQVIAYAWEHEMEVIAARRQWQLDKDRKRIDAPPSGDNLPLIPEERPTVQARDLGKVFDASTRQIREYLVRRGVRQSRNGDRGKAYRFDKEEATRVCDEEFTRIKPSSSGRRQTAENGI